MGTGSVLCEELVDQRLQRHIRGHDRRGLHHLDRLAEQQPGGPMPTRETERAVCCQQSCDN